MVNIAGFIDHLKNPDQDLRFMALNDLSKGNPKDMNNQRLLSILVDLLHDPSADVQLKAVNCLEKVAPELSSSNYHTLIQRLSSQLPTDVSITSTIYTIAYHVVLDKFSLEEFGDQGKDLVNQLLPALLNYSEITTKIDYIERLTDLIKNLGYALEDAQIARIAEILVDVALGADKIISNRSISALGYLVRCSNQNMKLDIFGLILVKATEPGSYCAKGRFGLEMVIRCLKTDANSFADNFDEIWEFSNLFLDLDNLSEVSDDFDAQQDLEELRYDALRCLTTLFSEGDRSKTAVYILPSLEICSRLLVYSPYSTEDDEDLESEDDLESDLDNDMTDDEFDDGEGEGLSWRVRKSAAALVAAIVEVSPLEIPVVYQTTFESLLKATTDTNSAVSTESIIALTKLLKATSKDGPYYSLRFYKTIGQRRGSDVSMISTNDPLHFLLEKSRLICETLCSKVITDKNSSKLDLFYQLIATLSDCVDDLEDYLSDLLEKLEEIKKSDAVSTELLRFYASIFTKNSLKSAGPTVHKALKHLVSSLSSFNNELAMEGISAVNRIIATLVVRKTTDISEYGEVVDMTRTFLTILHNKNQSAELRQACLSTLVLVITHFSLDEEILKEALSEVTESLKYEMLVSTDLTCIRTIASKSTQTIPPYWFESIICPLVDLLKDPNFILPTLEAILAVTKYHADVLSSDILNKVLLGVSQTDQDGDKQTIVIFNVYSFVLNVLPVQDEFAKEILSQIVTSACSHKDIDADVYIRVATEIAIKKGGHKEVFDYIVASGKTADQSVAKILAGIALHGGMNNTVSNAMEALINGEDLVSNISFLGQAFCYAPVECDIAPFLKALQSKGDIYEAATVALANLLISNSALYLPLLLQQLEKPSDIRAGVLNALSRSLSKDLSASGEVWKAILLAEKQNSVDESECIAAAECLAKIAAGADDEFLVIDLSKIVDSEVISLKYTGVYAVKFLLMDGTLFDKNRSAACRLIEKVSNLIFDESLMIKQVAVSALITALHDSPVLTLPTLTKVIPQIIETQLKPEKKFMKVVRIGPFKHNIDDGLSFRRSLYELFHTLAEAVENDSVLFALTSSINYFEILEAFFKRGLKDDPSVVLLCLTTILRILTLNPALIWEGNVLESLIETFNKRLGKKMGDGASNQEIEKHEDITNVVVKYSTLVDKEVIGSAFRELKMVNAQKLALWTEYINAVSPKEHRF